MEELKKEPVTACLILSNILVFLLVEITGGSQNTMHMLKCGAAYGPAILEGGEYYRLFTSMFLHFGMAHLANNMLVLLVIGQRLEPVVGKLRFGLIYLLGGLGGNVISLWVNIRSSSYAVSAGASGAVFAVVGAMLWAVLRNKGRVQDITGKQMLIMAFFSVYFGFASEGVDNVAHLGGLICGFVLCMLLYHPRNNRKIVP